MDSLRVYWPGWIDSLRRQGLDGFAAWLLEAGGPINVIGAQLLYLGQPFVTPQASDGFRALANLLEQEDEARAFAARLRSQPNASVGDAGGARLEGESR